jgi:SAM-dependent methyltransferase
MLEDVGHPAVACADVTAVPLRSGAFDVVLAVHMLHHVPDRQAAVREAAPRAGPGGACIAVTTGTRHLPWPQAGRTAGHPAARLCRQASAPPTGRKVSAKSRERRRESGVPEIPSKARLTCLVDV